MGRPLKSFNIEYSDSGYIVRTDCLCCGKKDLDVFQFIDFIYEWGDGEYGGEYQSYPFCNDCIDRFHKKMKVGDYEC
ncbi:hypothetical protein [Spiroplasma melliferum]|uniref:Uncharacterized protein n=2 Tax=Spiroplasma melliferum TaxID=2134 RepID=A0AAI9T4T3_SPIME|nr:hypothetical protein [Spiroplasma melliferum]KAI93137.1 hypothetical protein SPM_001765 [Spiroplasma melliferum KC3]QCO24394.1 hypothetical protein SRED_002890 [Spiroplasma melliferum]